MTVLHVADVAVSVAGHGLAGSLGEWPDEPIREDQWPSFLLMVRSERLTGLLTDAIASARLPVTPTQAAAASDAHFQAVCSVLMLESRALRTVELLSSAGVDTRVLKGSAVAHLDYPDPAQRLFVDVDLLVRADDFDRAVAVLVADGLRRLYAEPRPGFDRKFGKGASFDCSDGLEIDLHRTFVLGPFGLRVALDDLWRTVDTFDLGGLRVSALDDEMRFLHACFHALLGNSPPRLVPQRDVAQMVLNGRLDVDRVLQTARRWQAEVVVAEAIKLAWRTLRIADVTALSAWAAHYSPTAQMRRDLAVYSDGSTYSAKSLAALGALPRLRDKAAFVVALTFPRRDYLTQRGKSGNRLSWLRRGATRARRPGGGEQ